LVELDDKERIGLVRFAKMKFDIEDIIQKKVDLLAEGGVSKYLVPIIDQEKVLIYEKATNG
jgi:uncharacterized protein